MGLKVLYVTVQFPVPSETFTAVEIRALGRIGTNISVATLKSRPRSCDKLMAERGLAGLEVGHNSILSSLRGLWACLARPRLAAFLIGVIFSTCRADIVETLKSLVLLPRSLDLFLKIRQSPPDVIHLYWGHYPSLLGLLVQRFLPTVPVTQSLSAYDLHSRYGPALMLSRLVPVVFTLARANQPEIEKLGVTKDKIHVVYHGVDTHLPVVYNSGNHDSLIVVAERLVPLKRTDVSLRVFQRVLDRHPGARLTILGDGPERSRLEALASELDISSAVQFMGHVSHEEVFARFMQSKVFLTMSSSERLPNTVKEAMLANCICVVSRTVGIDELIDDQRTGFIVEQEDVGTAANWIGNCLENWSSYESLRKSASDHIVTNFSSTAVARQKLDVWQELAKSD